MKRPSIAALQMTSGLDVVANLDTAQRLLGAASRSGACVAVLPENFAFMGRTEEQRRAIAEPDGDGPIQAWIGNAAQASGLWVIAGTVPLRVAGDERPANACLVYDAAGRRVARYDKIHLFDVQIPGHDEGYRESDNAVPGREPALVDTPAGRVGLSVCYDLRFPELYRRLVGAGAEILTVPAAFTAPTGRAHWEVLLRARAIENLCFVVAAAQSGMHPNGRETYGDSLVVDYWGRVVARRPRGTGLVTAEVDRDGQRHVRERFPALAHRVLERA